MTRLLIPQDKAALTSNNFDALRLFLALLVVWSHNFALWYGTESAEPITILLREAYKGGDVAVLGFFTISGFLITLSYARSSSPWRYLGRRVRRIYPGYLVALLLCSLVIVPAFSSRPFGYITAGEWPGMASNLLLRNYIVKSDAFGGGPVNGSLWSIPFEFWCYLGVLVAGVAGLIHRRAWWWIPTIAMLAVRFVADLIGWRPGAHLFSEIFGWPYIWLMVGPSFLLGALAYQYRKSIPRNGAALIVMLIVTIASAQLIPNPCVARVLLPPTFAYLILYLAFDERLKLHGAARYGDFSYGTYLYAFPIQQLLIFGLRGQISFWLFVPIAITSSLAAGVISWFAVERWFVRKAEAKLGRHVLGEETVIVAP